MKPLNPALPPATISAPRLRAVVLDWAGTTVDYGSVAPARTLQRLFTSHGIDLTDAEIRRDMGIAKKEHIRALLALPRIAAAWAALRGAPPAPGDVDALYRAFLPMQLSCLLDHSALIPGIPEAIARFRARGLAIGSTTGYTREMLDALLASAAPAGYAPDCSLTPAEAGAGRPHPFMIYACAIRLQVYPMAAIAKVGDTPADIHEALNAGAWAIGVAATGNAIGLTEAEFTALPQAARESLLARARAELQAAGAHFVIDAVADLDPVLDAIDACLAASAVPFHP